MVILLNSWVVSPCIRTVQYFDLSLLFHYYQNKRVKVYNNDRQQTNFDQKSLLELLAQVSYKDLKSKSTERSTDIFQVVAELCHKKYIVLLPLHFSPVIMGKLLIPSTLNERLNLSPQTQRCLPTFLKYSVKPVKSHRDWKTNSVLE